MCSSIFAGGAGSESSTVELVIEPDVKYKRHVFGSCRYATVSHYLLLFALNCELTDNRSGKTTVEAYSLQQFA